ncbi:MAG TPA: hypothetical protein VFL78_10715 [Rhodanobacteraceae bacterium]|nr:hypothetical protein [Rhodanobacteraceae bacterium]
MSAPRDIQQAIDRAAAAARREFLRYREQEAKDAARMLEQLAADIRRELLALDRSGGPLSPAAMPAVRDILARQIDAWQQQWSGRMDSTLSQSAQLGAGVLQSWDTAASTAAMVQSVMQYMRTFRAADGLQLSDRIWRTRAAAAEDLQAAIENGIMRGQSSMQAAQAYLAQGSAVPADILAGERAAHVPALASQAERLLTNPHGDVLYNVQRVIRTESNRAFTESYVASVATHPDVVGVKFNLSPAHPKVDICDFYAHANLHGLGPGIYPPGQHPYPAHPNTLSYLTTVFRDQVSDADRDGQQSAFEWLKDQSAVRQDAVLGSTGKGKLFREGQLQESELRTPLHRVQSRLGIAS